jgi:hypothetical protein
MSVGDVQRFEGGFRSSRTRQHIWKRRFVHSGMAQIYLSSLTDRTFFNPMCSGQGDSGIASSGAPSLAIPSPGTSKRRESRHSSIIKNIPISLPYRIEQSHHILH